MSVQEFEKRFHRLLCEVGAPGPFDLETFCQRLATVRGRPLTLLPFTAASPDDPTGVWLSTQRADFVFFEQATSPLHRDHIVLHELGHLLCAHEARYDEALQYLARLLPDVEPETLSNVLALRRGGYTVDEEREAETFARVVGSRIRRRQAVAETATTGLAGAMARAFNTLGPKQ